jgi:predicted metal-dependent peptidase
MVEYAPATGGLALWMRHVDVDEAWRAGETASPVATDGRTVFYRPAFASLPLAEQTGLVAHQVLHVALRHAQRHLALDARLGDADLELFNVCADAIVNTTLAHLSWLALPEGAVRLEEVLVRALALEQSPEKSLLEWDVERLYRAIDDRRTPQPGGPSGKRQDGGTSAQRPGKGGGAAQTSDRDAKRQSTREDGPRAHHVRALAARIHADLLPGAETQGPPEAEAEEAREWSERILRAHAGDGPHSMLRALIADLPKTRTPWEQVLRTQLARSLAAQPGVSWSRPSRSYIANQGRGGPGRRMPWEPGRSASRAVPRLAVIVDVSGSIDDALMTRFARELEAITRRMESRMVVIVGDDAVRHVEHFEPGRSDLAGITFAGAGGTDFTPLLEEADRHAPDIGVVLTDLEGPARFRPRWPVIWAVPEAHAGAVEPFGRKVVLA